jgi:spore photoproduct lyase
MFDYIYVEDSVKENSRTQTICSRYKRSAKIPCERYGEVFNRKNQHFRIQKKSPSLILAEKYGQLIWPVPEGFGLGSERNYYFSHFLNCPFDCRYCFLQGMFSSASFVFFVNYEDFKEKILSCIEEEPDKTIMFFSGYDGDSLAMESLTDFVKEFVPFFASLPENISLELRTKSSCISSLLEIPSSKQCVVAFSLTPDKTQKLLEHRTASISKRLESMSLLASRGWPIGLRFDPLIYIPDYEQAYKKLFSDVFSSISEESVHSVTLGSLRLSAAHYQKIIKLYPDDPLFALGLQKQGKYVSYKKEIEMQMQEFCVRELSRYLPQNKIHAFSVE